MKKREKLFLVVCLSFLIIFLLGYYFLILPKPREVDYFPVLQQSKDIKLEDNTIALVNFNLDTSSGPFPREVGFIVTVHTSEVSYRQVIDSCKDAGSDDGTEKSGYGNWFCDDKYYSFSLEGKNVVVIQEHKNIKKIVTKIPVSETVKSIKYRFSNEYNLE